MSDRITVIPFEQLKADWRSSKDTGVPGHGRWAVTPVGGPPGYEHLNRDDGAVTAAGCTVGLTVLPTGTSAPGVHVHEAVDEVYVVVRGRLAVVHEDGTETVIGPYDTAFIPAGVPHGVRNAGLEEGHLWWFKTGNEPVSGERS